MRNLWPLRLSAIVAIALLLCATAFAADTPGVSDTVRTPTLSNASGNCLAANGYRRSLTFDNTGGTINIGYCETDPSMPNSACTAAIGTAGTTTLVAGALHYWRAGSAPQNQFCFIAASGTPGLTIREGQ